MNFGIWLSLVSKNEFRLAPDSFTHPFTFNLSLAPPFSSGRFWMRWTFGCEGSPIKVMQVEHPLAEVEEMYREFVNGPGGDEYGHKFIRHFFKLPE
jgi:hypothetical protein